MKTIKFLFTMMVIASVTFLLSCGDDDSSPDALALVSISASGTDVESGESVEVDLNAATSAVDVPVDLVVTLTFDREVDETTVSEATVSITGVTSALTVSGASVTLTPASELTRGTQFTLSLGAIAAADGGEFTATTRTFTTGGRPDVTPPQAASQQIYINFDGDANDQVGSNDPSAVVEIEFQEDRHGQAASAAYFDGDASIIEYSNGSALMDSEDFTISFWIKTQSEGHVNADGNPTGMFVLGLGAFFGIQYEIFGGYDGSKFAISYTNPDGDGLTEDMWFPSNATDNSNGGWQGWSYANSLTPEQMMGIIKDTWYHVIYTFDGSEQVGSLYFNGELMKSFDFSLWPDDGPKYTANQLKYRGTEPDVVDELALGFIHSRAGTMWDAEPWGGYDIPTANHFKGWMDDFRIFHAPFSADDAASLYDAEKP